VPHDVRVGRLQHVPRLGYVAVHVDQAQKVEAERRGESTQQPFPAKKKNQDCNMSPANPLPRAYQVFVFKVPSASLTLHSTELCTKFRIFSKKFLFLD
jgi:hypothetical protein